MRRCFLVRCFFPLCHPLSCRYALIACPVTFTLCVFSVVSPPPSGRAPARKRPDSSRARKLPLSSQRCCGPLSCSLRSFSPVNLSVHPSPLPLPSSPPLSLLFLCVHSNSFRWVSSPFSPSLSRLLGVSLPTPRARASQTRWHSPLIDQPLIFPPLS